MLRSSWDTLSGTGLGRGKKGKVPHRKPQASPSPTPSLTFLPAPSCTGSLPGIQQFLQVLRPAWTCPGPPEDKKSGFRLPPQHPSAYVRARARTHTVVLQKTRRVGSGCPPTPQRMRVHARTHTHTHTHTHCGVGGEKLKNSNAVRCRWGRGSEGGRRDVDTS